MVRFRLQGGQERWGEKTNKGSEPPIAVCFFPFFSSPQRHTLIGWADNCDCNCCQAKPEEIWVYFFQWGVWAFIVWMFCKQLPSGIICLRLAECFQPHMPDVWSSGLTNRTKGVTARNMEYTRNTSYRQCSKREGRRWKVTSYFALHHNLDFPRLYNIETVSLVTLKRKKTGVHTFKGSQVL